MTIVDITELGVTMIVSAEEARDGNLDALRRQMRDALESAARDRGRSLGKDAVTVEREPDGSYAVRMTAPALKQIGPLPWDPA